MVRSDDLRIISAVQREGGAGFDRFRELVRRGILFTKRTVGFPCLTLGQSMIPFLDDGGADFLGRTNTMAIMACTSLAHQPNTGRVSYLACGRGRGLICTVAVIPAARTTPSGTSSMWMRTGMRWARRTQVKIGLTVASPC